MKRLLKLFILSVSLLILYIVVTDEGTIGLIEEIEGVENIALPKLKVSNEEKHYGVLFEGDLYEFVGKNESEVLLELGEPIRKDMTPYGYTWWIYQQEDSYLQVGIENKKVVTILTMGEGQSIAPLKIGDNYNDIASTYSFESELTYKNGLSFYTYLLKDEDLKTQPLIQLSNDLFLQCYFDTLTDKLFAIRVIKGETLLKQQMYELEYRGPLGEMIDEHDEQWDKIERKMEQQIFEMTNVVRHQFDLKPLLYDENVSEVAYLHSKDMYENNYFSHERQNGDGLKVRLEEKDIYYALAGENLAAQHSDAAAAMLGWLNSEGHREALLNDEYSHIGVGVHHLYYTQNFLTKP